ncbi:prephenate dehydratase [Dimargaris verticillata]|uniref:prephenate dehydratase n=1 Tax=Dimargaris verticillata TaxID=2761393 RepID=A0A9W8EA47_9FUNG|nr:prephenate dehydratase [Dimargaris verticillata]
MLPLVALLMSAAVSYLGPPGTFTYEAAVAHFGPKAEFVAQPTIEDVFGAVEAGSTTYGLVPFENSNAGTVSATLDRFLTIPTNSNVQIVDQHYLPISQCLLSNSESLAAVTRVYSHPMGFNQCRQWLHRHLPNAEQIEVASTAKAAQMAAAINESRSAAAIGNTAATKFIDIKLMARDIQDHDGNITRFFVLSHQPSKPTGTDLTFLYFTVDHRSPGALHQALASFADHGVNLTKIDTRPTHRGPWNYYFFIECTGHQHDRAIQQALQQLQQHSVQIVVLGSYPMYAEHHLSAP